MTTKKSKITRKVPAYATGAQVPYVNTFPQAPVTDAERQAWNSYVGSMRNTPGYGATNWDHDQTFQRAAMQKAGFDPSRVSAIQADMIARNQSLPGTVAYGPDGLSKADSWVGHQTKDQSYRKYEYIHYDKNGKEIGHISPGFTPMTSEQTDQWVAGNRNTAYGTPQPAPVAYDTPAPAVPAKPLGLASNGFPTREEAIARARAKGTIAPSDGTWDNGSSRYSVDAVRSGQAEDFGTGGAINPWDSGKYGVPAERLYATPLGKKIFYPTAPTYGKGGRIRRYDDGGPLSPENPMGGATSLPAPPTGTGPNGDGRWENPHETPQAPPTGQPTPPPPVAPPPVPEPEAEAPEAPETQQSAPGEVKHKYYGFSTTGLAMGALQGADALVTQAIYNPRVRAREAMRMRAAATSVSGPQDFYGTDMGMYGRGGKVGYSYAPYTGYGDGGVTDRDFETMPGMANALVESQEQLQLPNGQLVPVTGSEFHSDKANGMGGKFMELEPGTRVFSKKKLIDKNAASAITNSKVTRKQAPAELVKRYDTKKEEEILKDRNADPIATNTASLIKNVKDGKKDEVFAAQEIVTGRAFDPRMEFGGTLMAGRGGMIYADGGATRFAPGDDLGYNNIEPLTPAPLVPITEDASKLVGPTLEDGSFRSKWEPKEVEVPEMPEIKGDSKWTKFKNWAKENVKGDHNLRDLPLYAPEFMATLNAMTDQPIFSVVPQPKYVRANQMNVQADLNRAYSMSLPALQRSQGAGDATRLGALATLIDNANQVGQYKTNYDAQQRTWADNTNAQIENQFNARRADIASMLADKMAQRTFNKQRSIENAMTTARDTAYNIKHGRALERNSLGVLNKMYPNWQYGPNGLTPVANGPWFHNPYSLSPYGGFEPGDGIRSSETIKIGDHTYKRVESDRN